MSHYLVKISGKEYDVSIDQDAENYTVTVNKEKKSVSVESLGGSRMLLSVDNHPNEIDIRANDYDTNRLVFIRGVEIEAEIEDFRLAQVKKVAGAAMLGGLVSSMRAPMPGLILEIKVSEGAKVRKHGPLLIIEAMKMENVIKAPADVAIKRVAVSSGQSVEKNDLLISERRTTGTPPSWAIPLYAWCLSRYVSGQTLDDASICRLWNS
jgi:acetyl/propionyl-CoA carboxylase alpha subunit